MSLRVKPDELTSSIEKALSDYSGAVLGDVREAVQDVGKETVDEIRERARAYGWKDYAKTWTVKTEALGHGAVGEKAIVHARTGGYQIAHLLERSHPLRGGGRSRAFPHIEPAENKAENRLFNLIRQKIGGG